MSLDRQPSSVQALLWVEAGAGTWHTGVARAHGIAPQRTAPMKLRQMPDHGKSLLESPGATWQRFMRHSS